MTHKESNSIEVLLNEYEKMTPESHSPDPQELTSWHKSNQSHFTYIKTVHSPKISFLPKLPQTEKKIQLKPQHEQNFSTVSLAEHQLNPTAQVIKLDFASIDPKKLRLNTESKKASELKSLENLITRLKEIPSKIMSKASSPPQMKSYLASKKIYRNKQSLSPKISYFNSLQKSENIRKVIGFTYQSTLNNNTFDESKRKNNLNFRQSDNKQALTKANKFPCFHPNSDQNKSAIYSVLSQKTPNK